MITNQTKFQFVELIRSNDTRHVFDPPDGGAGLSIPVGHEKNPGAFAPGLFSW